MSKVASHDLWVISDSDVRVTREYLRQVVLPFADAKVGCVTCLYRGIAAQGGLWSRLEAAGHDHRNELRRGRGEFAGTDAVRAGADDGGAGYCVKVSGRIRGDGGLLRR